VGFCGLHLKKLISLILAACVPSAPATFANAASGQALRGAGSTLAGPLLGEWAQTFRVFYGVSVNYDAFGSLPGINAVSSRTVDFGASDAPLTAAQAGACHSCYQIPWAVTGIGVGYHLHGVGTLHLTGGVLAEIFSGQLTRWNDPRITALNAGARLPALKITPIYTNSSGATYAFTDYLSRVSASWRAHIGHGIIVSFPTGLAGNGNVGATALLASTNGSIAYIGAAYLIAHRLPAAAIQNAAGNYEYPNLRNIASAARTIKHVPAGNALSIVDPPSAARAAYPISSFVYAIVPANAPQRSTLKQWLSYTLGAGETFGPALDFATIPPVVLKASRATIARFASHG
jgi:phosphate transport system substrate-binding protein